ncbi:MAG TPA: hypothetical protein PLH98_18665 [Ruminococcus flavefaciens]|nr:hypothetical protein [Ruminococcus flavefaciens]
MNKAIIAVSAFSALAAIVFKTGDFGAIPAKADCMKYKKRCRNFNCKLTGGGIITEL